MSFNRQRSRGSLKPISSTGITTLCDGSSTSTNFSSAFSEGNEQLFWDNVTPGFRTRSAAGEVIISNMRKETRDFTFAGGGIKMGLTNPPPPPSTSVKTTDYDKFLSIVGITPVNPPNDTGGYALLNSYMSIDQVVTAAATQVMANVSPAPVKGLAILGEGAQTLSMLLNPLSAVRKYLAGYRRFKGRQFAEMASDQFLEVWFGLKPFLSDIEDIVAMLQQLQNERPERETARASVTISNTEQLGTTRYSGSSWYIDVRREMEETFTYRRGILYHDSGSLFNRRIGYRLSDIPAAVVELSPWSFAVDWFVNLSALIQALTPVAGVQPLGAWESWSFHQVVKHMVVGSGVPTAGSGIYTNFRPCSDVYNQTYIVSGRNAKAYGSDIGITVKPDWFQKNTTLARVLTAASLTVQQLKGLPPRR